jgi:hypothetical protein
VKLKKKENAIGDPGDSDDDSSDSDIDLDSVSNAQLAVDNPAEDSDGEHVEVD